MSAGGALQVVEHLREVLTVAIASAAAEDLPVVAGVLAEAQARLQLRLVDPRPRGERRRTTSLPTADEFERTLFHNAGHALRAQLGLADDVEGWP